MAVPGAVDPVIAEVGAEPGVRRILARGRPVTALVARSHGADLLVVGHRGRGLHDLLLGSVAKQVATEAACPVVIVRPSTGHENRADGRTPSSSTDTVIDSSAASVN